MKARIRRGRLSDGSHTFDVIIDYTTVLHANDYESARQIIAGLKALVAEYTCDLFSWEAMINDK